MAKGYIYVVTTVTRTYEQRAFCDVPTEWGNRLYFGPCKRPMRPRMSVGDYIFGISPRHTPARRILFVARIEEVTTFAEAYRRFPDLHGPSGPIHVRPINGRGAFPQSSYQHIPRAMHAGDWEADLASPNLDRFFMCRRRDGLLGRWLGSNGPEVDDEILTFLNTCHVYGSVGRLGRNTGTLRNPVGHGRLFKGLHLETDRPEDLVAMCRARMPSKDLDVKLDSVLTPPRRPGGGGCGAKNSRSCR